MGIPSLIDRRSDLRSKLFVRISNDELHVLRYLLPTNRDTELINRLRSAAVFPPCACRHHRTVLSRSLLLSLVAVRSTISYLF